MKTRAKITVTGRVQKAGYRDFVDEVAYNLQLNGYVKNLKNGTVEIICEGGKDNIEKLAKKINIQKYPIRVENVGIEYSKATGKFKEFTIVREENITKATYERMDVAARYMREMHTDLKDTMVKGNTELKEVIIKGDTELKESLGSKIDSLGNRIDSNFNKMDQKYDVISERMITIMDELKQARIESAKTTENLTKVVQTFVEIYKIH
ncbi:MAG: acylphosphatase [Thermoplasmata archaeon]